MGKTTRFAILEPNSGYVWGVVDAESAIEACSVLDRKIGGRPDEGAYEPIGDLDPSRDAYDVRLAPAGFDADDGQDPAAIAAVNAMPAVGLFAWTPS
ncbi:MAG TPA: hypothetical protein PLB26_06860 [Rubrivivax sp.]|nr:hypothetical protein [Rubrivivax sp.]